MCSPTSGHFVVGPSGLPENLIGLPCTRTAPVGLVVERADDGSFVVRGRAAERAVALSDLTNLEALAYVQERLRKLGVDKALAKAGAKDGDVVAIGRFSFEYAED